MKTDYPDRDNGMQDVPSLPEPPPESPPSLITRGMVEMWERKWDAGEGKLCGHPKDTPREAVLAALERVEELRAALSSDRPPEAYVRILEGPDRLGRMLVAVNEEAAFLVRHSSRGPWSIRMGSLENVLKGILE